MSDKDKPIESLWGLMKGSVLHYENPFEPAIDPMEWEAIREVLGLELREGYIFAGSLLTPETGSADLDSVSGPGSASPSAKP